MVRRLAVPRTVADQAEVGHQPPAGHADARGRPGSGAVPGQLARERQRRTGARYEVVVADRIADIADADGARADLRRQHSSR
jgi:hypothetical protein